MHALTGSTLFVPRAVQMHHPYKIKLRGKKNKGHIAALYNADDKFDTISLNAETGRSKGTLMRGICPLKFSHPVEEIIHAAAIKILDVPTMDAHVVYLKSALQSEPRPAEFSDLTTLTERRILFLKFPDDCNWDLYDKIIAKYFGQDLHEDYDDGNAEDTSTALFTLEGGCRLNVVINSQFFTRQQVEDFEKTPWQFRHAVVEYPAYSIVPFQRGLIHGGANYFSNDHGIVGSDGVKWHCRGHTYHVALGEGPPDSGSKVRYFNKKK